MHNIAVDVLIESHLEALLFWLRVPATDRQPWKELSGETRTIAQLRYQSYGELLRNLSRDHPTSTNSQLKEKTLSHPKYSRVRWLTEETRILVSTKALVPVIDFVAR